MPGCCFAFHLAALSPKRLAAWGVCHRKPLLPIAANGERARGCSVPALHPCLAQPLALAGLGGSLLHRCSCRGCWGAATPVPCSTAAGLWSLRVSLWSAGPCSLPVINCAALMPGAPKLRGLGDVAVWDPACFSCTLPTGIAHLHLLPPLRVGCLLPGPLREKWPRTGTALPVSAAPSDVACK